MRFVWMRGDRSLTTDGYFDPLEHEIQWRERSRYQHSPREYYNATVDKQQPSEYVCALHSIPLLSEIAAVINCRKWFRQDCVDGGFQF